MSTIVALTNHGLVASDRIYFGNLDPDTTGIIEGSIYYVLAAGLTLDQFQFSETDGGAAFTLAADITAGIVSKAAVYTPISDVTHVMAPPTAPDAATGLALTSATSLDVDGHAVVRLDISLTQPTNATLRQTVVTVTPAVGDPIKVVIPAGQTTASIHGVPAGLLYSAVAHSYDTFGNVSAASSASTETPPGDTTPPAQVTGLAGYGAILGMILSWNASAATDLAHYEVQMDDNSGFTSPDTFKAKVTVLGLQQIAVGTYYFRVRAVDLSGNAGAYSSTVTATSRTVQTADLTDALITTAKLVAGSVTDVELASAAVTAAKIAVDAVTAAAIAAGEVGNSELAAGAVTASKITAGTITANEIAALTIVAGNIAAGTITAAKIAAGTITTTEIAALTIVASNIAAGTITAAKIAAGTITANEIAALTITAANIAAATITGAKIAANTITAANITAGTITATELAAGSVTAAKLNIQDAFGATVLDSNGFGGSWLDFLSSGLLYNSSFESGDTTDIAVTEVGSGATVADYLASAVQTHLPFWVVAASGGTVKVVTDVNAPGGKALQFSGTGGQVNRIYQDFPVPSNRDSWSVFVDYIFSNMLNASDAIKFYASWRTSTHAIIGSRVAISSFVGALGAGATSPYGQLFLETDGNGDGGPGINLGIGISPPTASYLRFEIEITHQTATFTFTVGDVFATPGVFKGEFVKAYEVEGTYVIADTLLTALAAQITNDAAVGGNLTVTGSITHGGVSVITPTGAIIMYGGSAAPSGYLLCDGTSYFRATYPDLFTAIGTAYGAADGTHFNVPDLRQRFPLGLATSGTGSTLGATGGAIDHTHTGPSHTHTGPSHTHTGPSHTHTMANHTHTGPSHTHTGPSHTHTSAAHTHTLSDAGGAAITFATNLITFRGVSLSWTAINKLVPTATLSADTTARVSAVALVGVTDSRTPADTGASGTGDTGAAGTGASGAPSTNTSDASGTGATGADGTGATGASGTAATGSQNPPFQVVNFIIKT